MHTQVVRGLALLAVLCWTVPLFAQGVLPPVVDSPEAALAQTDAVVDYIKTGQWAGVTMLALQVIIFVLKKIRKPWFKRWGMGVIISLSSVSAFLALLVGGLRWHEALLAFAIGPLMTYVDQLWNWIEELRGKRLPSQKVG